jgi:hypothetical protein
MRWQRRVHEANIVVFGRMSHAVVADRGFWSPNS